MMTNLFSIFDTSTNFIFEMNWMSSFLNLFFLPLNFWLFKSSNLYMYNYFMNLLYKEFKIIFNNKFNMMNSIFLTSIMMMIFLNNFLGLYPYIFTSSSHMIFSLSFSLPMWLSFMFMGWINNSFKMLYHMIPQSTPIFLMPFMVIIELISNIIRPMTLSIRLTANMIAGHLLLTLLSQSAMNSYLIISFFIIFIQMFLLILEFSVSIIQSYVFTILSTLYLKETN